MSDHDKLAAIACPQCGNKSLSLSTRLRAKPLGTFSLAGGQTKVSAREIPVIACAHCDFVKFPKEN